MRKVLALILVAVLSVSLFCACKQEKTSDAAYVKEKGTLIVGITDFAPMDYRESENSSEWIGFDADMAKEFAKYLGVDVKFVEIADWGKKSVELETKAVDVVWNGMTLDDEVRNLMGTSEAYCKNAQVVVMNQSIASQYTTTESLKTLTFAVETESAGMKALRELGIEYTAVDTQAKALMEVASGAAQATVIDLLMAGAMIGEGTSYADLTVAQELTPEEYGVGFRKESDLIGEFNKFWKQAYDNGTVMKKAEQYGIAKNIIAK